MIILAQSIEASLDQRSDEGTTERRSEREFLDEGTQGPSVFPSEPAGSSFPIVPDIIPSGVSLAARHMARSGRNAEE
jgi:hypothetical protein